MKQKLRTPKVILKGTQLIFFPQVIFQNQSNMPYNGTLLGRALEGIKLCLNNIKKLEKQYTILISP